MAQEYSFIDEITPLKENVTIKIRIIRLWKPRFDNPIEDGSIEMVFLDEKGSKIQASVKKSLIRRFTNLLEEGQLRIIANFGVGQSTGNYRPTQHPYKINFFFTTSVQICDELPIPLHGFNFVSLDDILSKKLDDKYLVGMLYI
ncbi:Replication factor A protein 1 [Bienertia sinuspersici]